MTVSRGYDTTLESTNIETNQGNAVNTWTRGLFSTSLSCHTIVKRLIALALGSGCEDQVCIWQSTSPSVCHVNSKHYLLEE